MNAKVWWDYRCDVAVETVICFGGLCKYPAFVILVALHAIIVAL